MFFESWTVKLESKETWYDAKFHSTNRFYTRCTIHNAGGLQPTQCTLVPESYRNKYNKQNSKPTGVHELVSTPSGKNPVVPPSLITVTRGQYARNLGYFEPMLTGRTLHLSNLLCLGADDGFSRSRCTHSSFVDRALGGKAFDAFHRCSYFSKTVDLATV